MTTEHAYELGHILGYSEDAPSWSVAAQFTEGLTGEQAMAFKHGYDDGQAAMA